MCMLILTLMCLCPTDAAMPAVPKAVTRDGRTPLALLVGVNRYRDPDIPPLQGAEADLNAMHHLLTGPGGYGFPAENVMVLLDEQATYRNVVKAVRKGLIARARPGQAVVLYFSCHGSQFADLGVDEADRQDEVLLLHDSRLRSRTNALYDDTFNALLAQLYQKTTEVTVILDACTSATATRTGGPRRRYAPVPTTLPGASPSAAPKQGPTRGQKAAPGEARPGYIAGADYRPRPMPELVVLAAAHDGAVTADTPQGGSFTLALLQVLRGIYAPALTYADLQQRMYGTVAATRPAFEGNLQKPVFGVTTRAQPQCLRLTADPDPDGRVLLEGFPQPGMGPGAELRVYAPDTHGRQWLDPAAAKGLLVVEQAAGMQVRARLLEGSGLAEGDMARLVRPSDSATRLRLAVRGEGPGALTSAQQQAFADAFAADDEADLLLEEVAEAADPDLMLVRGPDDALLLLDPQPALRGIYPADNAYRMHDLVRACGQHARIRALLALSGESGPHLRNNASLALSLVTPRGARLPTSAAHGVHQVPACAPWYVRVTNTGDTTLHVAGYVLSGDAGMYALPEAGRVLTLAPGAHADLGVKNKVPFRLLPAAVPDHILLFGSEKPFDWRLLGLSAERRRRDGARTREPTFQGLDRYLRPGSRLEAQTVTPERQPWVTSLLTLQTADAAADDLAGGELDLRPLRPRQGGTAWGRLLDLLAESPSAAGTAPVWDLLARAGLGPAPETSPAKAPFPNTCLAQSPGTPWQAGDLMVLGTPAGRRVVLVLDPVRGIGWGPPAAGEAARFLALPGWPFAPRAPGDTVLAHLRHTALGAEMARLTQLGLGLPTPCR